MLTRPTCPRDGAMVVATTDPLIGTYAGEHRVVAMQGVGNTSRVYRGFDAIAGSGVALKTLAAPGLADEEAIALVAARVHALANIVDDCLVATWGVVHGDAGPWIALELIDGWALPMWLSTSPSLPAIIKVILEMLAGLEALHTAGIHHGTLHPGNVMVTRAHGAKLLACSVTPLFAHRRAHTGDHARAPLLPLHYMAPEQFRGAPPSVPGDVYAAAAVLLEMLVAEASSRNASTGGILPIALHPIECVISRALAPEPADRWSSAAAMANALWRAAEETSLLFASSARTPEVSPRVTRFS